MDKVERNVLSRLVDLKNPKDLEEICALIPIECPADKKGKTNILYKYIVHFLTSEAVEKMEDEGTSIFVKLRDYLGPGGKWDEEVDSYRRKVQWNTVFDVKKLKDFKLSGLIGSSEKKEGLSYSNITYQISNGVKQGYSEEAVLRATSPGNHLRTYMETKKRLKMNMHKMF